jgi:putative pyruvate formate lyase activating enzyme
VLLGLHVPLVYNTGGYDSVETLRELEGIISVYLPDLRYSSNGLAKKYSRAPDYVTNARAAIREMYRQVGDLAVDGDGIAQRGLIVRHLVLPSGIAGSRESLGWLAREVSPSVAVSIMSQYAPVHRAPEIPLLYRKINASEYEEVLNLLEEFGLENGWVQKMDASESYLPDFEVEGDPFSTAICGYK